MTLGNTSILLVLQKQINKTNKTNKRNPQTNKHTKHASLALSENNLQVGFSCKNWHQGIFPKVGK